MLSKQMHGGRDMSQAHRNEPKRAVMFLSIKLMNSKKIFNLHFFASNKLFKFWPL